MHILNPEFFSNFKIAGMNLAVHNFLDKMFDRDVDKTTTALFEMQQFIDRTEDYGSPLVEAAI